MKKVLIINPASGGTLFGSDMAKSVLVNFLSQLFRNHGIEFDVFGNFPNSIDGYDAAIFSIVSKLEEAKKLKKNNPEKKVILFSSCYRPNEDIEGVIFVDGLQQKAGDKLVEVIMK